MLEELKKKTGEVRGEKFRTHAEYIIRKKGVKGLKDLEKKVNELGFDFKFKEIKPLNWYPAFMHPVILLVAKDLFSWDDEEIIEMGRSAAKISFIGQVLIKYFVSLEKFLNEIAPEYWQRYYNFGDFKVSRINEEDKFLVEIRNYDLHPITCLYNSGYFEVVTNYLVKSKKLPFIEETKCIHRGDDCHEFIIEREKDSLIQSEDESYELIKKLKDFEGKTRGVALITTVAYIQKMKGENGIKIIEQELERLGYPLDLNKIDKSKWYNSLVDPLMMVIARQKFNWQEKDFYEAGYFAPQASSIASLFLRYFVSIEKIVQQASRLWKNYFDFGELRVVEMNKENNYIIIEVKDFDLHPLICQYHRGYYVRIASFSLGQDREITAEETKCIYRGDDCHEYKIKWKA